MYLYRGQDIGGRDRLLNTCRRVIENGTAGQLYDIIPHIRVLRDTSLLEPLASLLNEGNTERRSAAAMALGSLGVEASVQPLMEAFRNRAQDSGRDRETFRSAVIMALGDLNYDSSVAALMEIYRTEDCSYSQRPGRDGSVVSSLGQLAQQGIESARKELFNFCYESNRQIRGQAATELAVAYWHTPNDVPEDVLSRLVGMAREDDKSVRAAAIASLSSLSQLGSKKAQTLIHRLRECLL